MGGGHGPGPLHPPDGEGVAESLVRQVVAAGQLAVHLVALQHLVQEVDVARGQLEDLDLAELVRGQGGDDLAQGAEGVVQGLRALPLPHVGDHSLAVQVLEGQLGPRPCPGDRGRGAPLGPLGPRHGQAPGAPRPSLLGPAAAAAVLFGAGHPLAPVDPGPRGGREPLGAELQLLLAGGQPPLG